MKYWGHWRGKNDIEKFFVFNKLCLFLSVIFFCFSLKKSSRKFEIKPFEKKKVKRILFSKNLIDKKNFHFPPIQPQNYKLLENFSLFHQISSHKKEREKQIWISNKKKNSLSYLHHLKQIRKEEEKAIKYLLEYQIKGIVWSNQEASLVVLTHKKQKLYLKRLDRLKNWVIVAIHQTSVDFQYDKNSKITKTLFVNNKHGKT